MARATISSPLATVGGRRRALVACAVLLAALTAPTPSASARPADAFAAARACTIVGTAGADKLIGTARADLVCGRAGADSIRGGRGADTLVGGGGGDLLQGKSGTDRLRGDGGDDTLYGGAGPDRLRGGPGSDRLGGGFGADDLSGGRGRDIVFYGQRSGAVRVSIGKGANDGVAGERDKVRGDVEDVRGGGGNDVLIGNGAANELFGGGGRDRLVGKGGSDVLMGGDGNDVIDARDGTSSAARAAAGSVDRVVCGGGEDTALVDRADIVDPGCEHVQVVGGAPPPQNHAPTGLTLSHSSVAENEPVGAAVGTLSASDPDPGDTFSYALVPGAGSTGNGSFRIVGSTLETNAVFDYETQSSYSVRIRATDHGTPAGQIVRRFTITVIDRPEAPVAVDRTLSIGEDDPPATITLSATSPEGLDVTSFTPSAATGGSLGAVGPITCSGTPKACSADVDFTPNANFNGAAGFTYTARDSANRDSDPATVTITVTPVNDTPTASPGSRTTDEDTALPLDLAALVDDVETPDANLTYTIVSDPTHGDIANGTYTPDLNFNGTDTFTYKVTDRGDPNNCTGSLPACDAPKDSTTETVSIAVDPVNDTPVAAHGDRTTDEDTPVALNLDALASDVETSDANLTYTIETPPAHGVATTTTYTPNADFNGTDTVTYKITDRGDPDNCASAPCAAAKAAIGTVTITVNPVNDAPTASPGSRSTPEDTPLALDLGALVSDAETSDANLTYTIVSDPTHGDISGSTYTPDTDFNGSDSFTYKVTDRGDPDGCSGAPCDAPKESTTETVSITVDPVNDAPVASDGARTTDEDTPVALNLAALVSDVETADSDLTYHIVSPAAHGVATSTTYTPDGDFNGTDTFQYSVTDRGDPDNCGAPGPGCDAPQDSATKTVTITVNAVNDAPVNTVPAGPVVAVQDTDKALTGISVTDVDAGSDDVQVTLGVGHGTLTVSQAVPLGLVLGDVAGNGTGTVVITASLAKINTTLAAPNGLVYHGDAPYTGPDTLTVTTNDLNHNGSGGAKTDTDTLGIVVNPPNAAPVADAQSVTTNEDTPKTVTLTASDADGDALTFALATGTTQGVLGPIGPANCTGATPNVCNANVTYTPDADFNGSDSFTFTANDSHVDSAPATVGITVNPVNDAPELANTEAGALAYTENDPATFVTATTTVTDIDSADFAGGTLTVDWSVGGTVDDRLELSDHGPITVAGSTVSDNGTPIGTFTGGSGPIALVVTLNASATPAATQDLVRAVTYRNVSDAPSSAARSVRLVLTDGDGGTSAPATRAVALTAVNDAPVLGAIEGSAVAYVESVDSAPAQSQVTNTLTAADPDNANLSSATVQITTACQPSEDVLVFANQNGISGSYTAATCLLTLTGSSSVANYQAALRSVKYETTSDTPNTTTRTIAFQVDDGAATSHASNTQSRDVTVTASNDSPTGVADALNGNNSALAGVTLAVSTSPSGPNVSVSGNVLDNDTDPDTPHASLTATAGTSSTQGGTVAVNSGGTFTYTPAPGVTGADTFTYTVHDNDSPARTGTGTVTINVVGPRVWFVDPGASAGNGTSASPLNSLAPLSSGGGSDSLDGSGDVIFVYQGTGNAASGGFVLEGSQRLVGQPQGLSVTDNLARTFNNLVAAGGSNPTVTNGAGAGLTLADGNTIQRVNVSGASGVGVTGSGVNTLTYGANTTISGNAGGGLALSGAAGGAVSVGAAISTAAGHSVSIANRTSGTTTLSGAVNDTGTGVSLTGNTGATIDLTGGVTASTGANPAFTATGGGTVDVTGAANTLTATTASALNVANTTIGASGLNFRSIASSGGSSTGIILDNTGASGGLTVSGSGTAGSGGTIATKTGADGSTTSGIGIYLNNTKSPSFARMQLNDFQNFAIRGTSVNGFSLSDSTISGTNGTSTAADEASVAFDNLTGSGAITNDNISGGFEDDVRVQNNTGQLNSMSVTGSTFATVNAATANDALALLGTNGATTFNATVQNNTFNRAQGDLYQYTLQSGTGTMHFDSNTVTNNFSATLPAGGGDINVTAGSIQASPTLTYSINNNNIFTSGTGLQPPNGSVIVTAATPKGSATGTIQNNTIGATGVTQSGGFDSILANAVKAGVHKVTITGNTIRRYKEAGIRMLAVSPDPSGFNLRATVKGNTITEPDTIAFAGIDAEVGGDPSDTGTLCLDLGGTTAADKNSVSAGDPNNFNDINLIQQFATGMNLPGYAGAATDDAAVATFVAGRNNGDGLPTVSAIHDTTTGDGNPAGFGFTGTGTDCS